GAKTSGSNCRDGRSNERYLRNTRTIVLNCCQPPCECYRRGPGRQRVEHLLRRACGGCVRRCPRCARRISFTGGCGAKCAGEDEPLGAIHLTDAQPTKDRSRAICITR